MITYQTKTPLNKVKGRDNSTLKKTTDIKFCDEKLLLLFIRLNKYSSLTLLISAQLKFVSPKCHAAVTSTKRFYSFIARAKTFTKIYCCRQYIDLPENVSKPTLTP